MIKRQFLKLQLCETPHYYPGLSWHSEHVTSDENTCSTLWVSINPGSHVIILPALACQFGYFVSYGLIIGPDIAEIDTGLLVLVGIEKQDSQAKAERLLERLLGYRVFPDTSGRMNLSLSDIEGELLLVPQFTLAADTKKGMLPSFSSSAPPELGGELFGYLVDHAKERYKKVASGEFGEDMQVSLVNDGPVTFWIQV